VLEEVENRDYLTSMPWKGLPRGLRQKRDALPKEWTHATVGKPKNCPPRRQDPVLLSVNQLWTQGIDQVTRKRVLKILCRLAVANLASQRRAVISPLAQPQEKEAGHE
jgi:hypothetical protein